MCFRHLRHCYFIGKTPEVEQARRPARFHVRSFREQKLGNCEGSVCALAILILFSAAVFDMK
jgi:hypothetical protein